MKVTPKEIGMAFPSTSLCIFLCGSPLKILKSQICRFHMFPQLQASNQCTKIHDKLKPFSGMGPIFVVVTTALDPASLICALTYHHQEVFADLKQDDLWGLVLSAALLLHHLPPCCCAAVGKCPVRDLWVEIWSPSSTMSYPNNIWMEPVWETL